MRHTNSIFAKKIFITKEDKQHIKTPVGVAKLLEELWVRHKTSITQPKNNIFWIAFPPPTDEELEASQRYI